MTQSDTGESFAAFLTVGEAADLLGVSADTLRNWDRRGKVLPLRHPVNGYRLYRRADLEALVRKVARPETPKRSAARAAAPRGRA